MFFLELQHTCLELPGADVATLARIAILTRKLTNVVNDRKEEHLQYKDLGELHYRLSTAKQQNEKLYVQRLLASTDQSHRMSLVKWQLIRRAELIAILLVLHDLYNQRAETLSALANELSKLEASAAARPTDHPLVAYCLGLASMIRKYQVRFDLAKELSEVEDLELDCVLRAMHTIFEDGKAGLRSFGTLGELKLNLVRLRNPSPAQEELATSLAPLKQPLVELAIREHAAFFTRSVNWSKNHLAARLEASLLPTELRPEWTGSNTFDELKQFRDDSVADFLASAITMNCWKTAFTEIRARAKDALLAAYAELKPESGKYVLLQQFQTEEGIDFYKAMLNCIYARAELTKLEDLEASYHTIESDSDNLSLDVRAYISAVLRERSESFTTTTAVKPS